MTDQQPSTANTPSDHEVPREHHVCPVWIGRLLVSPIRRLVENPTTIVGPLVQPGSTVIDVGCAMGFYSLDMARLVGPSGRVVCLDVQQEMLDGLVKRARRKRLNTVIETRRCSQESLGIDDLAGQADLVTAFHVVHETTYPRRFLRECAAALAPGGRLLVAEPRGHVSKSDFERTVTAAESAGLIRGETPAVWRSLGALLSKPPA